MRKPGCGIDRRDFAKLLTGAVVAPAEAASEPIVITDARLYHKVASGGQPVKTSFGIMNDRHMVLLQLRDERGNSGFGESWINFPVWAHDERIAAFRTGFLPYLKRKQAADIPGFVRSMAMAFRGPALQSGTIGPLVSSLCAISMALTDLAAKRKSIPLAKLLFENPAPKVRIYGSGINAPLPWKSIDSLLDRGVRLFKLKVGFRDEDDLRNLKELKRHLGGKAEVAVDVNRNWSFTKAAEWVKTLAGYNVQWLEEPLTVQDEPRMAKLAGISRLPLAGGENVLVEPGGDIIPLAGSAFAIVQPDASKYCTTHDFLRVLPEAQRRGKRVIPHCLGSAPGQAFSIHLAAGCSADPLVEWDANENPLHTEGLAESFRIEDGCIGIPAAPGLGWTPMVKDGDRVA